MTDTIDIARRDSARQHDGPVADAGRRAQPPAAEASTSVATEPKEEGRNGARRKGFLILAGVVLVGLVAWGAYEFIFSRGIEETDDAYVAGDVVAITAREPGIVMALHADNTERVKAGQALVDLDPATADAAMASAQAELARAVRAVRTDFSRVDASDAQVTQARAELARAVNDLARRRGAAADGAVSGEEVSHAADAVTTARAALALAQAQQAQARASVQGTNVQTNPEVLAAIAALRRAAISQSHMRLVAPVDGIIAQRSAQLGQQVNAGTPLMTVVPLERVWIDANFRETQLQHMRVGQPVTVTADIYGGDVEYHGKVVGLSAGSGSAFALLPPQNASGNWIKIAQRLPVRIALDPRELVGHPLRIGLSTKVSVNVSDHSGAPIARAASGAFQQQASQDGGPDVDAMIARIIAANRAGSAR
ncbi:MAG: EmrA/EmrK family multidrug efflux transporter periplasmic adaptor subunit [Sphingobium sp.]|nr:MAG: EmrA/EmrK family multidrug efflux transporter periplasmic adaptor subunit [Sphingobium sp.]